MSLVGVAIGSNETEPEPALLQNENPSAKEHLAALFAAYVKWIPSEVVVVFGAWVTANWAHQQKLFDEGKEAVPPVPPPSVEPRIWWLCLLLSIVLVPILVWLAEQAADKVIRKTLLAGIGFVIWSASISHSYSWSLVRPEELEWVWYGPAVVILGGVLAKAGERVLALPVLQGRWRFL